MEPKKRHQYQLAVEQGDKFKRLAQNSDWEFYWVWVGKAIDQYERQIHNPQVRHDHTKLVEALGAYDAVKALQDKFNQAIKQGEESRQKLYEEDHGKPEQPKPDTGF